jgi:hypothetical protein
MCAHQEQANWDRHQKFLRGCILVTIVNLFPQREIVICARVELERGPLDLMEHYVGTDIISQICESPFPVVIQNGDEIKKDLQK